MNGILSKLLTVLAVVVILLIGLLAGSLITKGISGENPVQMIQRWRDEDAGIIPVVRPVKAADPEPDGEQEPAVVPEGAGTVGKYYVEIKGCVPANDYYGEPALIVTYAWTNNGKSAACAADCIQPRALQSGVVLSSAMLLNNDNYNEMSSLVEAGPGETVVVQTALSLLNQTAPVNFQLTEPDGASKDVVSMRFGPEELG